MKNEHKYDPLSPETAAFLAGEALKRQLAALGIEPEAAIAFLRDRFPVKVTEVK